MNTNTEPLPEVNAGRDEVAAARALVEAASKATKVSASECIANDTSEATVTLHFRSSEDMLIFAMLASQAIAPDASMFGDLLDAIDELNPSTPG